MQMTSDKPILPVVTASVSTTTNATPVPSETQANTLPMGFESSDLLLTPPATDLPSRSLASPVKRILQLDEEQDVTSRLEEVRAVLALHHSATVLTPVRKSCQNSSRPWIGWRRAGEH
jgi:hypothetical protein